MVFPDRGVSSGKWINFSCVAWLKGGRQFNLYLSIITQSLVRKEHCSDMLPGQLTAFQKPIARQSSSGSFVMA